MECLSTDTSETIAAIVILGTATFMIVVAIVAEVPRLRRGFRKICGYDDE